MTSALIKRRQALSTSYVPEDERPARPARAKALPSDAIEAGAIAIYGVVTRTDDPEKLNEKWARVARNLTKERHRLEAEACLRAAGRIA